MKKKYIIWVLLCCIVSVVAVTIASFVYKSNTGEHLRWYIIVFVPLIFTGCVFGIAVLGNSLENRKGETFETRLSRRGINSKKTYIGYHVSVTNKVVVVIDFDSKQFASNLIYRYVVPFSRVASGRIEVLPHNLSQEKCVVQYVISIIRKDNDAEYDYIELFDTVVDKSELGENDSLTEQMFDKYPTLSDILALNEDVQKILEMNISDGVAPRLATDEEWADRKDVEFAQPSENDDPHYTKPPYSDKRW